MGCCFSTPNTKQDQNSLKNQQPQLRSHAPKPNATHELHSTTPPPQPVEEECVKEVLLETPISKPRQVPILIAETNTQLPNIENRKVPIINKACNMSESFSEEEVSQISETCTTSECFSTTTTTATTVTEKREDEATSNRRSKSSNAVDGNRIGGRERRPNPPARMPEKRIPVSSSPIRQREYGQVRRHPGVGSSRGSRSPSSARTVSEMRLQEGAGQRFPPTKLVENEKENDVVPREESIENPLVSLECFIFL